MKQEPDVNSSSSPHEGYPPEEAYRSFWMSAPQGFFIIQDGKIIIANPASAALFGLTTAELKGLAPYQASMMIHPDDRGVVLERLTNHPHDSATDSREVFRILRRDRQFRWAEMTMVGIEFGGRPASQAVLVDITDRIRLEREHRTVATVAASLRAAESRSQLMALLLEQILHLVDADGVALAMVDAENGDLVFEMARGTWLDIVGSRIPAGQGLSSTIVATGKTYLNNQVGADLRLAYPDIVDETPAVAGVPLIAAERTIGVLWMGRRTEISEDDCLLLVAIAEMAASALHRVSLHHQLEASHNELKVAYDSTLEGWARALELRDADTEGHTRRVVELSVLIAQTMGLSPEEVVHLRRGALLHDIGKMAIPDHILRKPGPLDDAEWEIMRRHPEFAREMLADIPYMQPALDIPFCHHEKWDGTGYPRGLAGEEIPIPARVFAVADVWDALTSDRPYRRAWSEEKAEAHITAASGSHFDPAAVEAFIASRSSHRGGH